MYEMLMAIFFICSVCLAEENELTFDPDEIITDIEQIDAVSAY
jgi:hypothetical protein